MKSAWGPRGYGSRAGPGAWGQLSRSRPGHVPLACTGAKDPLPWSGGHFEPLFSNPTFRPLSEYNSFQDLNRPSSRSKTGFVAGLWRDLLDCLSICVTAAASLSHFQRHAGAVARADHVMIGGVRKLDWRRTLCHGRHRRLSQTV